MRHLVETLNKVGNGEFIGIRGYEAVTSGEISNVRINAKIDVLKAKKNDLKKLKSFNDLESIAKQVDTDINTVKLALAELINSAERNVSKEIEDRTEASKAQTKTYHRLDNGIKIHKETLDIHIDGFVETKIVLKKGTYKTVNSSKKTLAKKAIEKAYGKQMSKYRSYKFKGIDSLRMKGEELEVI